jgi:acetoin utilization protein AcuB
MTAPAVTISPDMPFADALKLMRDRQFRRLPVVDKKGKLIGIVSERDLLHAAPSEATSLSVWEVHCLLSKLSIKEIMTKEVITATPDMPVEDAARLMVTHKIGGLPVVDVKGEVSGVVTETDIFKAFVDMLGGGQSGLRLTLQVPEKKGVLAALASTIAELGGGIESVGTFDTGIAGERGLVIKVRDVSIDQLMEPLEVLGDHVLDAREA